MSEDENATFEEDERRLLEGERGPMDGGGRAETCEAQLDTLHKAGVCTAFSEQQKNQSTRCLRRDFHSEDTVA